MLFLDTGVVLCSAVVLFPNTEFLVDFATEPSNIWSNRHPSHSNNSQDHFHCNCHTPHPSNSIRVITYSYRGKDIVISSTSRQKMNNLQANKSSPPEPSNHWEPLAAQNNPLQSSTVNSNVLANAMQANEVPFMKIPCKARGMPISHNIQVIRLLPHTATNSRLGLCSNNVRIDSSHHFPPRSLFSL